jgi:hypothetical protein
MKKKENVLFGIIVILIIAIGVLAFYVININNKMQEIQLIQSDFGTYIGVDQMTWEQQIHEYCSSIKGTICLGDSFDYPLSHLYPENNNKLQVCCFIPGKQICGNIWRNIGYNNLQTCKTIAGA